MKKIALLLTMFLTLGISTSMLAQPASCTSITNGSYAVPDGSGSWLIIDYSSQTALAVKINSYTNSGGTSIDWDALKYDLASQTPSGITLALYNQLNNYLPVGTDFPLGGPMLCCSDSDMDVCCYSYNCDQCDCDPPYFIWN